MATDTADRSTISRREFLKIAGVTGAMAAGCTISQGSGPAAASSGGGAFRIVHMTDMHLKPELNAAKGFARCMKTIQELQPRPDLIVSGGDMIESALPGDEAYSNKMFDLYLNVVKDSDIPIHNCIGNHDIFAWGSKGAVSPDHPLYGKRMFQQKLGLDKLTYALDHNGWKILIVDDIVQGSENPYLGTFDDATMDWVDKQFAAAAGRPKAIFTHIPVFTLGALYWRPSRGEELPIPGNLVCLNVAHILRLLEKHKVELVVTGHIHQYETHHYQYTTHIGSGAVCGNWWKGVNLGTPEGFTVIDFNADGTVTPQYMDYGWRAEA